MRLLTSLLILLMLTFSNCHHALYQTYTWGHFNIDAGYLFMNKMSSLSSINKISIVDTKADGNSFWVNGQKTIIEATDLDTSNLIQRASELRVEVDSLLSTLKCFYKIGVNEFIKQDKFYQFPVVSSVWTAERGYVYKDHLELNTGDTIQTKVGDLKYNLVLDRQLDKYWFEYRAIR